PPLPHEFQGVPHGTVRVHAYPSKSLGRRRGLVVYTPPDYEKNPSARYPVLYLFHGAGDNEQTWSVLGRAPWILDNILAQAKLKPILVVLRAAHTRPPG